MTLRKIIVVCSRNCDEIERRLLTAGCKITKVHDGEDAVSRMMREGFDAAIVISTGKGMDLAETVFNLADIRSSMPIFIISDFVDSSKSPVSCEVVAGSVPNARVLTVHDLAALLHSP